MSDMFGVSAEVFSGVAVIMSGYSLWRTSLRGPSLKLFVPPLIRYASPYQNSIFEVFEIPLTAINEGARTGTILSLDLEVTNQQSGSRKQFYSAGLGSWSLPKMRGEGTQPFTPLSLTGHSSHAETILFYAREDSSVPQIVEAAGRYSFELRPLTTRRGSAKAPPAASFEMILPFMDHRAFTSGAGTLPLYAPDWQPAVSRKVS